MGFGLGRGLDRIARHALPGALLLLGLALLALLRLPPLGAILRASFATGSVFFWALYRPSALPAPLTIAAGLLLGLLDGAPLGLWSVLLLLEQAAASGLRRPLAEAGFLTIWLAFALIAAFIGALDWAARCLFVLSLLPAAPVAVETGAAILLFPLAARLLGHIHRGPAAPELA